jgi:hypothetical protein
MLPHFIMRRARTDINWAAVKVIWLNGQHTLLGRYWRRGLTAGATTG